MAAYSSSSCLRREATILKKVDELTILCGVDACLIRYDSNNNLKIWPNDHEKVRKLAKEFTELPENTRRKRSVSAREILDNLPNKKQKTINYDGEPTFNPENYSSKCLEQALITLDIAIRSEIEAKNMIDSEIRMINHQNQELSGIQSQDLLINQDLSLISSFEPIFEELMYSDLFRDEEASTLGFHENTNECLDRFSVEEIGDNQNLRFQVNSNTEGCLAQLNAEEVRNQNLGFQVNSNIDNCLLRLSAEEIGNNQNLGFQVNSSIDNCLLRLSGAEEIGNNQNLGFQVNSNINESLARLSGAEEIGNNQNLGFQVNVDPIDEYLQQLNHQVLPVYQSRQVFNEPQFLPTLPPLTNYDLQPLNNNEAQYVGDYIANFGFQNNPQIIGFY